MAGAEALIRAAARNNAAWCAGQCRTHGIAGRWAPDAWTSSRRTPPFYPDGITLSPEAVAGSLLSRIDASAGASVKDSFAALDLSSHGFAVVHEAAWILRRPGPPSSGDQDPPWTVVRGPDELAAWAAAWDGTGAPDALFRAELLEIPDVHVLTTGTEAAVAAGAIVNRTGDLVGVSNLFTADGDLDRAWHGCLASVEGLLPGLAVVGYEAGDELAAARRAGFESIGPLRIWVAGG